MEVQETLALRHVRPAGSLAAVQRRIAVGADRFRFADAPVFEALDPSGDRGRAAR